MLLIEDVQAGKVQYVTNAQLDSILTKKIAVLLLVITVENGIQVDNAQVVITDIKF